MPAFRGSITLPLPSVRLAPVAARLVAGAADESADERAWRLALAAAKARAAAEDEEREWQQVAARAKAQLLQDEEREWSQLMARVRVRPVRPPPRARAHAAPRKGVLTFWP